MPKTRTKEECRKILFNLGIKLGVSPKLIATRLLSEEDKQDMLDGKVTLDELECHVKVWMQNGLPDYAHGNTDPYRPSPALPMGRYRGIGK